MKRLLNKSINIGSREAAVNRFDARRISTLALLTCIGLIVSIIENMFPPPIPLAPGAKLGLGNVASLIALIVSGVPDAFIVAILKCVLVALISGNVSALMYSVPSATVALAIEIVLYKLLFGKMSVPMISLIGAMVFNAVQLTVASLITRVNLITLLPWLMLAGLLAGAFTGFLAYAIILRLPYSVYGRKNKG
ncbi:MAG: Gx transporter family protein [Clostridiales bacterium]|nr:Gx transporter family protein [Clostridiales bacterium]